MTHTQIPVRLRFFRNPATWEIRELRDSKRGIFRFAFPTYISRDDLQGFDVKELDAWKCRERFFDLLEGKDEELLRFLIRTGVFYQPEGDLTDHWSAEVVAHVASNQPQPLDLRAFWRFHARLRGYMLDDGPMKAASCSRTPKTGFDWVMNRPVEFPISFRLGETPEGTISVWNTRDALLASVYLDAARGIQYKVCARPDCARVFCLGSQNRKMFCRPYCAHITSVRKSRAKGATS